MRARGLAANQGRCCDAVLRVIEARVGATRTLVRRDVGSTGDVEIVCQIGTSTYALEHTRIDPYPDRRYGDVSIDAFMTPVLDELRAPGVLPPYSYVIVLDVYALSGIKARKHKSLQDALVKWVQEVAPQIPEPEPSRQITKRGTIPGTRVEVSLQRRSVRLERVSYMRYEPARLEELRLDRMRKAIRDKAPKLAACRRTGAISVLVLEDDDIALSNSEVIRSALTTVLEEVPHSLSEVDFVYLVETTHPNWFVYLLKDPHGMTTRRPNEPFQFISIELHDVLSK